jgi:hypothetical protein
MVAFFRALHIYKLQRGHRVKACGRGLRGRKPGGAPFEVHLKQRLYRWRPLRMARWPSHPQAAAARQKRQYSSVPRRAGGSPAVYYRPESNEPYPSNMNNLTRQRRLLLLLGGRQPFGALSSTRTREDQARADLGITFLRRTNAQRTSWSLGTIVGPRTTTHCTHTLYTYHSLIPASSTEESAPF